MTLTASASVMTEGASIVQVPRLCFRWTRSRLLALWICSLGLLIAPLSIPSVERTQEARVLETAREMLQTGTLRAWLVPRLNGKLRLQKPPLAYWLSAVSFKIFGVHQWAGRLPFAVSAWLTLGLIYVLAAEHFGSRAGVFSAAALLGTYMFARHGRLAETDVLVVLFVTAAIYAFWRAVNDTESRLWWSAGSAAVGLTVIAKGLPAIFPLLFLLGLVWRTRRWNALGKGIASGAPFVLVAIAAPWFLYIAWEIGLQTLLREARVVAVGGSHRGWFFDYGPWLAAATLPWSGLMAVALAIAFGRWRKDVRLSIVLIWLAAVLLPLLLAGQKQNHYLVPVLAPLAVLSGWLIDRSLRAPQHSRLRKLADVPIVLTLVAAALAAPLVLPVALWHRGRLTVLDAVVCAGALTVAVWAAVLWRNQRALHGQSHRFLLVFAAVCALGVSVMCGAWIPSFDTITPEAAAARIHNRFGGRPICFYHSADAPLAFALRQVTPVAKDAGELSAQLAEHPDTIVLVQHVDRLQGRPGAPADTVDVPEDLVVRWDYRARDKTVLVCEARGRTWTRS